MSYKLFKIPNEINVKRRDERARRDRVDPFMSDWPRKQS